MTEDAKARRRAQRQERLKAALRENLRRRKEQARGRSATASIREPAPPLSDDAERERQRE